MTKKAIFDAFGTVVRIDRRTNPYRQLLREGIKQGRRSHPGDAHVIMTLNLELHELAERRHPAFRILASRDGVSSAGRTQLHRGISRGIEAVAMLRERSVALGISSNLAKPYGAAVEQLFPSINTQAFSFEIDAAKPDPRIYQVLLGRLDPRSGTPVRTDAPEVWIVGDSARCDRDGARASALVTPTVLNQARRCSPLS